jgi:hypothetical protein
VIKLGMLHTPIVLQTEQTTDRRGEPVLAVLYALAENEDAVSRKIIAMN